MLWSGGLSREEVPLNLPAPSQTLQVFGLSTLCLQQVLHFKKSLCRFFLLLTQMNSLICPSMFLFCEDQSP